MEDSGGPNYEVLEEYNDSNLNSARGHLCDILIKNPTSSCVLRRGVKQNAAVKVRFVGWRKLEARRACRRQLTPLTQATVKQ